MRALHSCGLAGVVLALASMASAQTQTTVEAAGAAFPYVETGEGETVLFVHGALSDHRIWDGLQAAVGARFRFRAVTMRHFGTGAWPQDKPYGRDVHEADLIAILQAWGEPTHLVGWSYSGPIVLRAAVEVPDLVRSVAVFEPTLESIVAGTPEGDAVVQEWYAGFADTGAASEAGDNEEAIREAIEYVFGLEEGGFAGLPDAAQQVLLQNAHTVPLGFAAAPPAPLTCEELASIRAPTLLIVGSETLPIFSEAARIIDDCIPDARIESIEGTGHGGPLMAPDAFLETLTEFLAAQGG